MGAKEVASDLRHVKKDNFKAYFPRNLENIFIFFILVSVNVFNFLIYDKLAYLPLYYPLIIAAGYHLGKRAAILLAFLTIVLVWIFVLANQESFLFLYDEWKLKSNLTVWGGTLILSGWAGSLFDKLKSELKVSQSLRLELDRKRILLEESNENLNKYNLALEDKVEERTQELVTSYSKLEGQMEEIKQKEEKLKYYAAELKSSNKELEHFAGVASHDLQDPLTKILHFSRFLLKSDTIKEGKERDYLERTNKTAERMTTLISDLLDLSRVTSGGEPFKTVNLNELVREVLDDLELRISMSKGTVKLDELPPLKVDASQFKRLFQNLIGNALKFNKKGEPPIVEVTCDLSNNGNWRIRVKDNGIGFDEEDVSRILKPFERLHGRSQYEGTGIGLAICKKIVERHGGTLSASSRKGEGSIFTISLPGEISSG